MTAHDLTRHNCIGIRQGDEACGVWRLNSGRGVSHKTEVVRINGTLTTNDGEIAMKWALEGHGILMRAEWDIKQFLADSSLVLVLPDHDTPNADIFCGVFAAPPDVESHPGVRRLCRAGPF